MRKHGLILEALKQIPNIQDMPSAQEDKDQGISKSEAIKKIGVSSSAFDAFCESIKSGGIFGRKLEGFKSESFDYKYVEFTNARNKKIKFTLVALSNVSIGKEDIYYKVTKDVILIWD